MINKNNLKNVMIKNDVTYTVYDKFVKAESLQDILCEFAKVLGDVVDDTNTYTAVVDGFVKWIENEGLAVECERILKEMSLNGELKNIIDEQVLTSINSKLAELRQDYATMGSSMAEDRHNLLLLTNKVDKNKTDIDTLKTTTSSLDTKVTQTQGYIQAVENDIDVTRTTLTDSINAVDSSKLDISEFAVKFKEEVLKSVYPIGVIYTSINPANPSVTFGGTWIEFAKGQTLVGVDADQTEFSTVEKTGGEKTHTLSISEMPRHKHGWNGYSPGQGTVGAEVTYALIGKDPAKFDESTGVQAMGESESHNNLQPYTTVYFWKRIG